MTETAVTTYNPEHDQIGLKIDPLVQYAIALQIEKSEHMTDAANHLLDAKAIRKEIDARFDPMIKQAHEAHKAAVAVKKTFTDRLDDFEDIVKPKILAYQEEQARLQRIADAEAAEKQRKIDEKAKADAAKAIKKGDDAKAAAIMENIPQVAPKNVAAPKVSGISYRTLWEAFVINEKKVPRAFLCVDTQKLAKFAAATEGSQPVAGVQFKSRQILAAGRR